MSCFLSGHEDVWSVDETFLSEPLIQLIRMNLDRFLLAVDEVQKENYSNIFL